ncbi:metallophosphoesterase [Candidatus Saccharibacteria bacterium]|nr:metallophosphoesterase [Candidatus Saccharibacteria bacterium]
MIFREPIFCRKPIYRIDAGLKTPVKVALTGDWHISRIVTERQREFLRQKLGKIKPDVIILQGDLFDTAQSFLDSELVAELKKSMRLCAKIAPTVMVPGNHDQMLAERWRSRSRAEFMSRVFPDVVGEWRKVCRETGVKLLTDSWFEVKGLRIFGFYQDPEAYYAESPRKSENIAEMRRKIKQLDREGVLKFKEGKAHWFAAHAPINELYRMKELKGFKVFSFGHTHGGCVPVGADLVVDACGGHGGLIAPMKRILPARFMRGREIVNNEASYIVNAGMVALQESAPKPLQYFNWLKAAEVTEVRVK